MDPAKHSVIESELISVESRTYDQDEEIRTDQQRVLVLDIVHNKCDDTPLFCGSLRGI